MQGTHSYPATDLLRRSTPTPLSANLCVARRRVRLETNSGAVLEAVRGALPENHSERSGDSEFLWKVIVEPDSGGETWPGITGFSDEGLSVVTIGQYSFIAVDLVAREAVAFLEARFTKNESLSKRHILGTLVELTKPSPTPENQSAALRENR